MVIGSQTNKIISSPSAQELSRYTIDSETEFSQPKKNLQNNIEAQNPATRGYPEWCRKVALSQGSGVGIETENPILFSDRFTPGDVMFDYEENAFVNALVENFLTLSPITFRPARQAKSFWIRDGMSAVIMKKSGFKMYFLGIPISYVSGSTLQIVTGDYKGWDHCPGGTQSTPNIAFYNMKNPRFFSPFGINIPVNPFSHFNYDLTTHSFSPTVGGFDLRTPKSGYNLEEDVFCNIKAKYDFFQIRKAGQNVPVNSSGHRYGYPYLMDGKIINGIISDHKRITPFNAVCAVGDKNTYPTILPNHFHVDDFQPDFLDFLLGEIAADTVYIQNRDIGNNTENYIAGFHTANYIYCGNSVFQKHSYEWKEPQGNVIINQHANIDMRAKEIIFETGVSVTGGASLHAYLGYTGYCTEDMSVRNSLANEIHNSTIANQVFENNSLSKSKIQNVDISIYPNPLNNSEKLIAELKFANQAQLLVFDLSGRIIIHTKIVEGKNSISVPENSKGIFITKIITNEGLEYHSKLVVY